MVSSQEILSQWCSNWMLFLLEFGQSHRLCLYIMSYFYIYILYLIFQYIYICIYIRSTPHPVTVTTRIITFLVGNPYKPSFATVTGWGVDPIYILVTYMLLLANFI